MVAEGFFCWAGMQRSKKIFYASLILAGIGVFFLRETVLNLLVPTRYPGPCVIDVGREVWNTITMGVIATGQKEFHRWENYFLISNIGQLLAVILGIFFLIRNLVRSGSRDNLDWALLPLPIGCLCALMILALTDSHAWPMHAIPVVPFLFFMAGRELSMTREGRIKSVGISVLLILVFFSAGVKILQGANIIRKGIEAGYNEVAVVSVFNNLFKSENGHYIIIGPTELWPYFDANRNVVIFDDSRSRNMDRLNRFLPKIDFIVLNRDYQSYQWERRFHNQYPEVQMKIIAEIGEPEGNWHYLRIIKPILSQKSLKEGLVHKFNDTICAKGRIFR
jgi:hypothetical protein